MRKNVFRTAAFAVSQNAGKCRSTLQGTANTACSINAAALTCVYSLLTFFLIVCNIFLIPQIEDGLLAQ